MFKTVPTVLVMLMAMSLVLTFRTAHATEPEPVVIAGGPKFRRPQPKKPGSSGSTTSQGAVAQGKSTSGQPYSNQTRQQLEKSKRSYEELIREHERKLEDYRGPGKALVINKVANFCDWLGFRNLNKAGDFILFQRLRELETQLEKQRSELKKIDETLRVLPNGD